MSTMNLRQSERNSQGFNVEPTETQGSIATAGTTNADADAAAGHPVSRNANLQDQEEVDERMELGGDFLDRFRDRGDWSQPFVEPSAIPGNLSCDPVDSLTLTNSKMLDAIFQDEEVNDSTNGTVDDSDRRHRRGGARSGHWDEYADSIVETKTVDG